MLINSLEIQNFGIYNGRHELELAPGTKWKNPRPIILVGGKNGAGKSTMFEAIKLCLYGIRSINGKTSNSEYSSYLKSRINWFADQEETTFIKLSFNLLKENIDPTKSKEHKYEITREWYTSGNSVKEDFTIYQDEKLLDIDPEFWQDFVEEIIPQGVVDLFFFDGEKIQNLANGSKKNLKEAIKSLLNLSIIPSLSTDLQVLYKKHLDENCDGSSNKEIKEAESEVAKLNKLVDKLKSDFASADARVNSTKSYIRKLEEKLKKEGGEFYAERDRLKQEQAKAKLVLNQNKDKISVMCGENIPFMLAPKLLKQTCNRIKHDIKVKEDDLTKEILIQKKQELQKVLAKFSKELKIKTDISKSLIDKISGYTDSWVSEIDEGSTAKLPLDAPELKAALNSVKDLKGQEILLEDTFKEIERLNRNIKKLEQKIELALESDVVVGLHNEINSQNQVLGSQERDSHNLDQELSKLQRDLLAAKDKIKKLDKRRTKSSDINNNFERVPAIKAVLAQFEKELTNQKIIQLEEEIYDCYSQIHRKSGFINRVKIDPETFEVIMFDKNQKIIPVDKLSAGEKQVYAISVLWALSKMSGKSLPMIIDTPLGRLDSHHRTNLVQNFFPNASHQVVILSTDTEIDEKYFHELNKYVSHTYSIDFNLEKGFSNLENGYLFQAEALGGAH
ncbi:MAG: DNA sulfur modification protein DndD [Bacteriovoracaceae bacterium]|jgi:DNA sulfur modification protein DndD|nr:DNA sulfur modification protein DndD [Bacteriovoracaceae bacterium]